MESDLINGSSNDNGNWSFNNGNESAGKNLNFSFADQTNDFKIMLTEIKPCKVRDYDNFKSLSVTRKVQNKKLSNDFGKKNIKIKAEKIAFKEDVLVKKMVNLKSNEEMKKNVKKIKQQREFLKKIKEENKEKNRLNYNDVKKDRQIFNTLAAENTYKNIYLNNNKYLQIKKEQIEAKRELNNKKILKLENYNCLKENLIKEKIAKHNLTIAHND